MAALSLSSCQDWLTAETPGTTKLNEAFTSLDIAQNTVNAAYCPLAWEYGNGKYYFEFIIGDIVSDDALKGGQYLNDGVEVRDLENFRTSSNNEMLLPYYRAQWQGISRANLAIQQVPTTKVKEGEEKKLEQLVGEAKFLRAYYYFRLCRVFGGMPLIDFVVDSSDKWHQERASQDDTYAFVIKDLEDAEKVLPLKSQYKAEEAVHATKGAAHAMLLKANLYRAGFLAQAGKTAEAQNCYKAAAEWGKKVIASNEYSLDHDYFTNFLLKGENDKESVFEIHSHSSTHARAQSTSVRLAGGSTSLRRTSMPSMSPTTRDAMRQSGVLPRATWTHRHRRFTLATRSAHASMQCTPTAPTASATT